MNKQKKKNFISLKKHMKTRLLVHILFAMIIYVMFLGAISCSSAPALVIRFQDRTLQLCQEQQIKDLRLSRDYGYVCYRYCSKYKIWHEHISRNCKEWTTDILDLNKKEDFIKLRDAGFILKVEGK